MKIFFQIMLIFLFISCGSGSKTAVDDDSAAVMPDSDEYALDDEDFVDYEDDEPYTKPDKDSDKSENDDDADSDPCDPNPCTDAWSTGICIPDEDGGHSCECMENYTYDGEYYCVGNTRKEECSGLPEHAHWSTTSTKTQSWFDGEWYPSAEGRYDWSVTSECCFLCDENYFWNGFYCVNLCETEPCKDVPHSDGVCSSVGAALYTCGCEEGYYWWGERLGCIARKPALGNVCTGQSECYDNSYEIECPADPDDAFFGQDAFYAKLGVCSPLDITVDSSNSDEPLVINRNTGLMWQQKITQESYTWENAIAHCEELTYAGYDDWRLPSVQELISIITSGKYRVDYNMTFFNFFPEYAENYRNFRFWTSNPAVYAYDYAWYLNFYNSEIRAYSITNNSLAICVRGEKLPASLFETSEVKGDEVVTDSATGLMWQKNPGMKSTWKEKLYYCEHLVYAGYSDWRLPNRNELLSLVNYDRYPASDFPGITSSSYYIYSSTSGYGLDLDEGNMLAMGKDRMSIYHDYPVYCVRSEICPEGQFLRGSECLENPCREGSCEVENSTGTCVPKTETDYECQCLAGYFWNGSECVNPCDANPCSGVANAKSYSCTAVNASLYICGCVDGYVWNDGKCDTFATDVKTVGSICTGQQWCYDDDEGIECSGSKSKPFSGQDAFYASIGTCLKQDFSVKTVNGQNIVVDNNTKLEWQQASPKKQLNWYDAYAYCDSLEYGGKSDWRLPAPHELLTIADISGTWAMLNRDYFTEIPENPTDGRNFWADNAQLLDSYEGWTVSFPQKDDVYFAMCVRGRTLPKANLSILKIKSVEVVKDSTTGLTWSVRNFSTEKWEEALSYCMNLDYAGYSKWRLPNKNELASLIGFDEKSVPGFYGLSWSSTTYPHGAERTVDVYPSGKFDFRIKNWDNYLGSGSSSSVICVGNFD